jgi:hypothetical protein
MDLAMRKTRPVESHTFAGMEQAVAEQSKAAALYTAEQLTARMLEPLGDISRRAGEMERNGPLFIGTGSNPTLF